MVFVKLMVLNVVQQVTESRASIYLVFYTEGLERSFLLRVKFLSLWDFSPTEDQEYLISSISLSVCLLAVSSSLR